MPIDYEALVAPFRTAFFLQRRSISESLRNIALWLTKRLRETEERERATRAFPVFGFSGSALTVWIDPSQHGKLGPEGEPPPEGFWGKVAAPFAAFWNGLLLAPAMIRAENVLPDILGTLARTVTFIIESLDRFKAPDKSMFDLETKKRWDDLIGEAGLFFRLVNDPATVAQVKTFSQGGIAVIGVMRRQLGSAPETPEGEGGGGLAGIATSILGASLVVPVAWQLLTQIATTLGLTVRQKLLDWASGIYREALGLRRQAIDLLFVTLLGTGSRALEWLVIVQAEVMATLDLYTRFVTVYLEEIRVWITTTGTQLKPFADGLIAFIRGLGGYLDLFLDIDFGKAATFGAINFKVGEILEWRDNPKKAEERQEEIDDLRDDHPVLTFFVRERLNALRQVIGIGARQTGFPAEAAPPDLAGIMAPNIGAAFLGVPEKAAFTSALAKAGPALTANVDALFDAGIKGLTDFGDVMEKAGTAAATTGSAARYRKVGERAAALAETAFGADAARAARVVRKDPIAAAFESWLAGSGFALIGRVLPAYVAEMIQFWKREAGRAPAERPTSPHIPARRAEVGRVRLARLVIRVNDERDLDKVLAIEIADRTAIGVARAYQLAIAQPGTAG